jgi:predicted membrane channel-forming protein YqfA (hemolysin III family)
VWTHLSALIGFFFLMFYAYSTWLADGSFSDKAMFLIWYLPHLHLYVAPVYLIARFAQRADDTHSDLLDHIHFLVFSSTRVISAQTLLFSSSFFHLTECMGPKVWLIGVRMDYTSISVLIVGSYFPYATICSASIPAARRLFPVCLPFILLLSAFACFGIRMIHYLFACHSGWQYFYIGLMLALGVLVVSISMSNYFQAHAPSSRLICCQPTTSRVLTFIHTLLTTLETGVPGTARKSLRGHGCAGVLP